MLQLLAMLVTAASLISPAHSKLIIIGGDPCEVLPYETCQREEGQISTDSTGTVTSKSGETAAQMKARMRAEELAKPHIHGLIENWKGRGIYDLRLHNLGLSDEPACSGDNNRQSPSCTQRLHDVLLTLVSVQADVGQKELRPFDHTNLKNLYLQGIAEIQEDKRFKFVTDLVSDQVVRENRNPESEKRIAKQFEEVRKAIHEVILEKFPASPAREVMIKKLKGVTFSGTDCRQNGTHIRDHFQVNAHYIPAKNSVQFCKGLEINTSSLYAISFVLGHELGHAIDPCRLPNAKPKNWYQPNTVSVNNDSLEAAELELPTTSLVQCLRSPKSVGAKRLSPFARLANANESGLCRNDQINEAVSDWIGVEALGHLIKKGKLGSTAKEDVGRGIANVFSFGCSRRIPGNNEGRLHPATRDRIEKVLAVQPDIRKAMGCEKLPSSLKYCSPQTHGETQAPPHPVEGTQ